MMVVTLNEIHNIDSQSDNFMRFQIPYTELFKYEQTITYSRKNSNLFNLIER